MKKAVFTFILFCTTLSISAQDLGVAVSASNYFPLAAPSKTSPITSINIDLNWWNPDKGFPVFGIIGFGYHYDLPGKLETIQFTNSTGVHKGDVMRYSSGVSTRYGWEIVQPLQHLSVYGGIGSILFRTRMEFKSDSPLTQGDYVSDSYGNTWSNSSYSSNAYARMVLTIYGFAGVNYELKRFNFFGQASFHYNAQDIMPFAKAFGINAGIFVPIFRI